ncbi:putative mitochondrial ATP-dependent helicase irc3 [Peziza echinospora]|nr:putative mitochondrial ATP-dependent helicase irc3 [Peziza echinospora]
MTKKRAPPQEETTEVPEVVEPPQKLVLRDYQEECIKAVLDHLVNYKRLAISLATGAGKTVIKPFSPARSIAQSYTRSFFDLVIFTQLIERVPPRTEQATQTLILVHRRELVEQARIHCQRHYPDKVIEVEMANQVASGLADITLASVQSITSKDRLQKYDPNNFNLILIDECHHAVSETYLKVLGHFGAVSETGPDGEIPIKEDHPIVVGVSATLSRHDGLALAKILDYLVYHKSYVDMIGDKHLSNVSFTTVRSEVDLSQVRATGGDFNISDLSAVVNTEEANEVTVRAWMEKAVGRKSTLVFCVDIAHVEAMTNKFRLHGIDAQYVTSLSGNAERAEKLARFRAGEFPVLVNCGIYTEGTDIPNIDCIVLARPTRSRNLLIQMIGRGMRLSPATGKENCHIIDMVGVIQKGIVTTPTLFGLDPSTILKDKKPEDMAQLAQQQERETAALAATLPDSDENRRQLTIKSVAFTDYDSIYDLLEDTAHDEWVRRISPYAWVKIGFEDYILSSKDAMLRVERGVDKTYTVTETSGSTWSTFLQQWVKKKPQVLSHDIPDLEHAIRGADSFAAANYPQYLILHSAPWRKAPATEAQIKQLYKMRPEGDWERKRVTKGQAADIQTRVKFGRAKWEKVMKLGQRMKEKAEKAESTAGGRAGGIVSDEIVVGRIADMVAMKRKSNMEEVEQELETEMEMEMETEKEEERLPSSEEKEKKRTAIDGDVWVPRVGDGWKGKWVRDEFA